MLGWEFPPYVSGGLGTACHGLTRAMSHLPTSVLFMLPKALGAGGGGEEPKPGPARVRAAPRRQPENRAVFVPVRAGFSSPYPGLTSRPAVETERPAPPVEAPERPAARRFSSLRIVGAGAEGGYDGDLIGKTHTYARRCAGLARREAFDVIHAHDWITFPAAQAVAELSGRPLIAHVHATEFDRSGDSVHPAIYDIERRCVHAAARVIAVSNRTKQILVDRYDVSPEKINVVHNGIEPRPCERMQRHAGRRVKTVLFLGRITMQKGPEFFVRAAARVAQEVEHVRFVVAGHGDLLPGMRALVEELGLSDRFEFAGFLRGEAVERAYRAADVYVMPSVSEPFGLTALEAARHGVPVVLSSSSGAAEVLQRGALKVDFWDVNLMARMIVMILRSPALAEALRQQAAEEIRALTWDVAAEKCVRVYHETARAVS
jgi:glycogen synthase